MHSYLKFLYYPKLDATYTVHWKYTNRWCTNPRYVNYVSPVATLLYFNYLKYNGKYSIFKVFHFNFSGHNVNDDILLIPEIILNMDRIKGLQLVSNAQFLSLNWKVIAEETETTLYIALAETKEKINTYLLEKALYGVILNVLKRSRTTITFELYFGSLYKLGLIIINNHLWGRK